MASSRQEVLVRQDERWYVLPLRSWLYANRLGEELQYILSDKTVSKQHLMVTIDGVKESDYVRSIPGCPG
jgi:hypothetical protein